jgi:RNA polymerase sigma-70 factor, ECF subfamily
VEAEDDAELMRRAAAGDKVAFASLFDRYQARVAHFAYRFVGDRSRAEDLTQDIFVKLFRSAKSYRPTAKFKTYLFRVAANHCLNEIRRGEYRRAPKALAPSEGSEVERAGPGGDSPHEAFEGRELEMAVGAALAEMSVRERAAFTMCRFEGMAYREIAEALSASEAAVKSLVHRATLAMAKKVEALQAGEVPARSRV